MTKPVANLFGYFRRIIRKKGAIAMTRRNHYRVLAISLSVILIVFGVSIFSSVYTISTTYAQETTTGVTDKIKAILLRPGGWLVEWRGNSQGVIDFLFEARGENIVVKINNAAWNVRCERDVTITSDVVKLDACSDKNITLHYDPNDNEYPFKGESQNVNYKLKAK
jgi:predicted PurR-regulated permease PerM